MITHTSGPVPAACRLAAISRHRQLFVIIACEPPRARCSVEAMVASRSLSAVSTSAGMASFSRRRSAHDALRLDL